MQIELREYQKQDFKTVETIIRETWHYDEFSSQKTAVKLARAFLSSCLTNYTFSRVAVLDDTTCNYGFYEHQGMIRRLEKEHTFHIKGQQKIINFFIYDSSTQKKMSE